MRIIMHMDVNNAYLSWTAIDLLKKGYHTDIRTIEAVIGGDETKRGGIVLAKSPVAKKKGVETAETLWEARKKCHNLQVFPGDHQLYNKMSAAVFEIVLSYSPDVEIVSVDECYIDYTNVRKLHGDPIEFAHKLKDEIYSKLGFTVNIGIANNKLCAKMASDFEKPNRVHTLFMDEIETKLYGLDVGDLYGIGKKSAVKLRELSIKTIGDLARADQLFLYKYFKNQAAVMIESAKGISNSKVITTAEERKGISISTTYPYNLIRRSDIINNLQALVEKLCLKLRREEKFAYVIGVKLRDRAFINYSHQRKLDNATSNAEIVFKVASELVLELWNEEPVRLMGVSLTSLVDRPTRQISLFDIEERIDNDIELDKVVDKIKSQYGYNVIKKASLADKKSKK